MKLIEHFVGGKIIPGTSNKKGKVFNPATGDQEKEVSIASKKDLDSAVEVAKKAGCNKAQLIDFKKKLPLEEIIKCNTIGLTSGASAPEKLVKDFISELKKHAKISIDEHVTSKEGVTFKLPSALTN